MTALASIFDSIIRCLQALQKEKPTQSTRQYPYQVYLDHRKALIESAIDNGKSFEKYIMWTSAGAIALSLTFLKDFLADKTIAAAPFLIASWILLVLSIGAILFSIFYSVRASNDEIEFWDEAFEREIPSIRSKYCGYTEQLNKLALWALILGVALLCWFAFQNVGSGHGSNNLPGSGT